MTNGWRSGGDPAQRILRIVSAIVVLAVFTYLSISTDRSIDDLGVITLAVGVLLVLLGYEGIVRLPWIGSPPPRDKKDGDDGP